MACSSDTRMIMIALLAFTGFFPPLAYGLVRSENDSISCIFAASFTRPVSNIPHLIPTS